MASGLARGGSFIALLACVLLMPCLGQLGLDVKKKNTEDATENTEVVEVDEEQEISAEVRHPFWLTPSLSHMF
jgi:hypothetical protein